MHEIRFTDPASATTVNRRSFMTSVAASGLALVAVASCRVGGVAAVPSSPILPGVPASVSVEAWLTLDLNGAYRWQSTKFAATADEAGPVQVHHGFLVATDKAVEVSDPAFGIHTVAAGGALALGEQQQLMVKAPSGNARIMFVELVAPGTEFQGEQPDSVKEFTVAKGRYIAAVLAIPSGANAPKPAQVVAKAAAPAIAITPEGASANAATSIWLVALFPVA
jgi:hypothetical protein